MRAVKEGLPIPSGDGEELGGPRSTAAVGPTRVSFLIEGNEQDWNDHRWVVLVRRAHSRTDQGTLERNYRIERMRAVKDGLPAPSGGNSREHCRSVNGRAGCSVPPVIDCRIETIEKIISQCEIICARRAPTIKRIGRTPTLVLCSRNGKRDGDC